MWQHGIWLSLSQQLTIQLLKQQQPTVIWQSELSQNVTKCERNVTKEGGCCRNGFSQHTTAPAPTDCRSADCCAGALSLNVILSRPHASSQAKTWTLSIKHFPLNIVHCPLTNGLYRWQSWRHLTILSQCHTQQTTCFGAFVHWTISLAILVWQFWLSLSVILSRPHASSQAITWTTDILSSLSGKYWF